MRAYYGVQIEGERVPKNDTRGFSRKPKTKIYIRFPHLVSLTDVSAELKSLEDRIKSDLHLVRIRGISISDYDEEESLYLEVTSDVSNRHIYDANGHYERSNGRR